MDLQKLVAKNKDIPKDAQETIKLEIRKIAQEFNETQRNLKEDIDKTVRQCDQLQSQLDEANRRLNSVIQDRSRISEERDGLLLQISTLSLAKKKSEEVISASEQKWIDENKVLMRKLQIQEEQLKGKRALWLEANPTSSARRDAMNAIRDPFNSPTAAYTPGFPSGSMSSMMSPSLNSPSQSSFDQGSYNSPPKMQFPSQQQHKGPRRRGNLPTGKAQPAQELRNSMDIVNSSRTFHTEPGDSQSMALILHTKDEDLSPQYKAAIGKVYGLIENWSRKYSNQPHQDNDRAIASSNQTLWDYMMNCTYPGHRQDSHSHVTVLLNDPNTRFWFIMRMAVQYCVKEIMSIDNFYGFSAEVDRLLDDVKKGLQERGMWGFFDVSLKSLTFKLRFTH